MVEVGILRINCGKGHLGIFDIGFYQFCEAVKVDVSKTKETNFQVSISNSVALVRVLFEDFGVAVELLEKAKYNKSTEEAFPSGHSMLFNETFEFEQGFLKTLVTANAISIQQTDINIKGLTNALGEVQETAEKAFRMASQALPTLTSHRVKCLRCSMEDSLWMGKRIDICG